MSAAATQTSNTLDDGTGRLSKRAWGALLVLCGALFLDALDVSMVGVALPSIRSDLGLSTSSLQWVVSAYVLGYGGFLLLGGRAADLLGRRKVFLISLGVFVVASLLGGFAHDGNLLIATRFIKGMSAAFTAPAGLSIITTSFAEGKARNKALAVYTATGATGFSLGLVIGGLLTEAGWRWVFFLPAPVALAVLIAGYKLVPTHEKLETKRGGFDVAGAVSITGAMLLLVYTLVSAPTEGWTSARTLGSFTAAAALLAAFVIREQTTATPLVRLGILRSGSLVRANLGAMTLFGSWVGFQFIVTLYLQSLRDWSPLSTGLAIFPGGFIVAVISTRMVPLVMRFGITKLILTGFVSLIAAYTLFLPIGLHSSYVFGMFPTMVLAGLGFALAFGPLTIAASSGVEAHEQGLAGGLLNTSFQFGGALMLAVTTAVINANATGNSPSAVLDSYHPGLLVPLGTAVLGIVAVGSGLLFRSAPAVAAESDPQLEFELEAA
jgi:EmrB/QacA subfamily drug resistance transporter